MGYNRAILFRQKLLAMAKDATVRARIDPTLKAQVEHLFEELGLSTTEAITLFYRQVMLKKGLPFSVVVPDETTQSVFEDTDAGKNLVRFKNIDQMFDALDKLPVSESDSVFVSAETAEIIVNDWLTETLPDRFIALEPRLIAGGDIWSVPVGLAYPYIGVIGEVGEVLVSAFSRGIISATQPEAMKSAGVECYRKKENAVKTAFLSARNA